MSAVTEVIRTERVEDVVAAVRDQPQLWVRSGGSKDALSTPAAGAVSLDVRGLRGILEYNPGEYTFTALAGTSVQEVEAALAAHGQHLPFDPPLVGRGATLGGTVAAGLSGSGRYRYGGVRDFLLGIQMVDGNGQVVRGGGKVVKNAAGFELPKLMVGSLGCLGVLTELCFKVFPQPAAYGTLAAAYPTLDEAVAALMHLSAAPVDLFAVDLLPEDAGAGATLLLRLGGLAGVLPTRLASLRDRLGRGAPVESAAEAELWRQARDLDWAPASQPLAKVALTPKQIPALDAQLGAAGARRRYAVGGNLAWISWPLSLPALDALLQGLSLPGLVILGAGGPRRLGVRRGDALAARVKQVLDPAGRFPEL